MCFCIVNGPIDQNKAKERGHFETAWHPQVQQRVQQQPVSLIVHIKAYKVILSLCTYLLKMS